MSTHSYYLTTGQAPININLCDHALAAGVDCSELGTTYATYYFTLEPHRPFRQEWEEYYKPFDDVRVYYDGRTKISGRMPVM